MPTIAPLPADQWSTEQAELMGPMQNNEGVGEVASNLFTTLVRHPKLFKRWSVFANHILFNSTLEAPIRELAILRTAWLCQADYEWGQHVLIARSIGMADETIQRIKDGAEAAGWGAEEAAVIEAADQLQHHNAISESHWQRLASHFGDQQILDLIFTVGNYRMLATVMNSIAIERDNGVPGLDSP